MTDPEYLFVYGTLMRPFSTPAGDRLRQEGQFVGEGSIKAALYDLGAYPGAVLRENSETRVYGEVYLLKHPEHLFPDLDEYEVCGGGDCTRPLYRRQQLPVCLTQGAQLIAWVYVYIRPIDGHPLIPSGHFRG